MGNDQIGYSKVELNVFVFKDEFGDWVLQALERDIAAQGATLSEAREAFVEVMNGQMILDMEEGREPLSLIPPAPQLFWDLKEKTGHELKKEPVYSPVPVQTELNVAVGDYVKA